MLTINLRTRAAAQNTLEFNSMCRIGDVALAASGGGLHLLGGYTDDGVGIPAFVKSGMLDLGKGNKSRFRFFYFGIETSGSITLSVYGDGELAGQYDVTGATEGKQVIRVPISREVNAWFWEWKVENTSGSFFILHSVDALPVILHRGHH